MREYWYEKEIKEMLEIIIQITDKDELEGILGHILTPREINDMARRLKIWRMLEAGESYSEIARCLNASPNFISKVSSQIGYGFRRSSEKVKRIKKGNIDPGKYLRKKIKYKGFNANISV